MPDLYNAAAFNQSEADFTRAAERAEYDGPQSVEQMKYFMQAQAAGLNYYIGRYMRDVVTPFNRDPETRQMPELGSLNLTTFATATFMTFKMVDGVYRDTGVELPDLTGDDLDAANPDDIEFGDDSTLPVIDLFFRGAELREKMPHIFRPSLKLMHELVRDPVDVLEKDLSTPLTEHRDPLIASAELHFIGGVAETVLAIEARAAKATA